MPYRTVLGWTGLDCAGLCGDWLTVMRVRGLPFARGPGPPPSPHQLPTTGICTETQRGEMDCIAEYRRRLPASQPAIAESVVARPPILLQPLSAHPEHRPHLTMSQDGIRLSASVC